MGTAALPRCEKDLFVDLFYINFPHKHLMFEIYGGFSIQ